MESHHSTAGAKLRLRDRNSRRESEREKRKSEVLIAAQSLDNEVQNVKNLKRISIGSIDLLMDPELEYRVNANNSSNNNNRNSWSSGSSSSGDFEEADRSSTRHSKSTKEIETENLQADNSFETSFDVTNAEYLDENDSTSDDVEQSRQDDVSNLSSSPVNRSLSGVGSLRRGAYNVPSRRPSSNLSSEANTNSNSSLTQNLLWVPADQHPNVKPENYLELVQDTLHSIKLEDNSGKSSDAHSNKENIDELDRLPPDFSKQHISLVRRPSRLRKSYTEFEEMDDVKSETHPYEINELQTRPRSSTDPNRPISLKDITEELTKISNNAGLTNSDAVTLARTLSMSGSFAENGHLNNSNRMNQIDYENNTLHGNDDKEFASNMFMKHGFVIPARSSLRRSKFNTYRKRTAEGDSGSERDKSNSAEVIPNAALDEENIRRAGETVVSKEVNSNDATNQRSAHLLSPTNLTESNSVLESPSSMNDFQDLYDHYRQPSVDLEKDIELQGQQLQKEDEMLPEDLESEPTNPSPKKNSWSWLNGIGERQKTSPEDKQPSLDYHPNTLSDDFIKATKHTEKESERLAAIKSNHSKNRHQPIFSQNNSKLTKNTSEKSPQSDHSSDNTMLSSFSTMTTSDKRQRLEMKFASLFKRKGKSKSKIASDRAKKHVHTESKKKVSNETHLTKGGRENEDRSPDFGKKLKKHPRVKSESQFEDRLRSVSQDDASIHKIPNVKEEELPALQPAISVTSLKSTQAMHDIVTEPATESVTQSVKELDGDDSQDTSAEQSYNLNVEHSITNGSAPEEQKVSRKDNENDDVTLHASVLPPRKLRFEDVKRPEKPNAPIQFSDSAFGFPLPMLTVSTVVMFDHRLPVNVERAIYRLSHLKLSDPKRELRQQVILSNFMYAYLNLVNHTLYMEQAAQDQSMLSMGEDDIDSQNSKIINNGNNTYTTEHNAADGVICIPDI